MILTRPTKMQTSGKKSTKPSLRIYPFKLQLQKQVEKVFNEKKEDLSLTTAILDYKISTKLKLTQICFKSITKLL